MDTRESACEYARRLRTQAVPSEIEYDNHMDVRSGGNGLMKAVRRLRIRAFSICMAGICCCNSVLAEVSIEGLASELESNVLALLQLDEQDCSAPARSIQAEFDSSADDIRLALEAYGYYNAAIDANLEFAEDCWTAEIRYRSWRARAASRRAD